MSKNANVRTGLSLLIGLVLCAFAAGASAQAPAGAPTAAAPAAAAPRPNPLTNVYPAAPPINFDAKQLPQIFTLDLMANDVEKSVKFYEDVMGMKVFMRRGNESFQSVFMAWPSADGKSLTLPGIRIMNDANFVHRQAYPDILLAVADPAPYVKRSNEAGYPVTRVTANNAFLNDPSGNVIEMVIHTTMNAFKNPNLAKK